MRLPNKYGSVFKLSGIRRKPYAVRINIGYKDNGSAIYKYIGYFEKSADAYNFLAKYNSGLITATNILKTDILFKQVFEDWLEERGRYKNISFKSRESYLGAFNQLKELHDIKFSLLRIEDLQKQIDKLVGMSESSISKPIMLLHFMYDYSLKHEYVEKDYSKYIIRVSAKEKAQLHKAFTCDEVNILWSSNNETAKQLLIYIYTGFRANELLTMKTSSINLKDKYMTGGMKTTAGKDRIVPIHNRILPLVKHFYSQNNEYLFMENGLPINYNHFKDYHVKPFLTEMGMKHTMHDTSYPNLNKIQTFQQKYRDCNKYHLKGLDFIFGV